MKFLSEEEYIERVRNEEMSARACGMFETAVAYQMQADLVESTGDFMPFCSWQKRGIDRRPKFWSHDGMLGLESISGAMLWLTPDVAGDVIQYLMEYVGWAPADKDWRIIVEIAEVGGEFSSNLDKFLAEGTRK